MTDEKRHEREDNMEAAKKWMPHHLDRATGRAAKQLGAAAREGFGIDPARTGAPKRNEQRSGE